MPQPLHPGDFIEGVVLERSELSIRQVAERLGVSASTFQRLMARKSRVSPDMALQMPQDDEGFEGMPLTPREFPCSS